MDDTDIKGTHQFVLGVIVLVCQRLTVPQTAGVACST